MIYLSARLALLYILKGKTSVLTHAGYISHSFFFFLGWLIVWEWGQRSWAALLMSSRKDACSFPSILRREYSGEVRNILPRGHFSLSASSHLIKQAQEMSPLADWPCVFLLRPPTGTSDVHSLPLWQWNHLTRRSPNSCIDYSLISFNTKLLILRKKNTYYDFHSPFGVIHILIASFPFSPLCPCPLFTSPLSLQLRPETKQTRPIKRLSGQLLKVPYFRATDN